MEPQVNPGNAETLIRKWLDDCQKRHASCSLGITTAPRLPKRVIDVGEDESGVKLYESAAEEEAEFVALSHCWGGGSALTTTSGTLEKHKEGIQLDEKSKTFSDAIHVTRALGIRYLWYH